MPTHALDIAVAFARQERYAAGVKHLMTWAAAKIAGREIEQAWATRYYPVERGDDDEANDALEKEALRAARAEIGALTKSATDAYEKSHGRSAQERRNRAQAARHARAAVPAAATDGWGQPLTTSRLLMQDFGLVTASQDLLGQLEARGAHRVDFNVRVPMGDAGGKMAKWVPEGRAKPIIHLSVTSASLAQAKLDIGVVVTQELVRSTDEWAAKFVEGWLRRLVVDGTANGLLNPALAAVPQSNPPSLTNGCFEVPSSGSTAAAVEADIAKLFAHFEDAGVPLIRPVLITSRQIANGLAWLDRANGDAAFPDVSADGGSVRGTPLLTNAQAGDQIVLADADAILFGDDGLEATDPDTRSALDMADDGGVQDVDPPVGAANMLPLWQSNSVALSVIRWCYWALSRPSVARVSGVVVPPAPGP